jgi:hypothetical protein
MVALASGLHAHVAASSATLLFSLGVNRLAQAAVIAPRALAMGVPFAPEKDGRVFMADTFGRRASARDGLGPTFGHHGRGTGGGQVSLSGHDGLTDRYDADDRRRGPRRPPWGQS